MIAERRGRFRPFYGCVNYPNCDFTLSARPIPEACPTCGNPYLLLRERKGGSVLACDKAGCGFEKPAGEHSRDEGSLPGHSRRAAEEASFRREKTEPPPPRLLARQACNILAIQVPRR